MPIPNLFIVGSWKAGTTSLYHYLNAHPDIYMSPVKEPHYFVRHSHFRPRLFWRRASYLGLFKNAKNAVVIGEASAYYFCMPESAKMIRDFNPNAKIIIMLRHPVDTIYAFHSECIFLGREHRNFAEALAFQKRNPSHIPNYVSLITSWPARIEDYQAQFGKENVHVIIFDDLIENTAQTYQKTLEFLGVNANFTPEFAIHNPSKVAPSYLFSKISGHPLTVILMQIACIFPCVAINIEHFRHGKQRVQPRPPMDEAVHQALLASFTPTVDRLSILLNRNLSPWKK